MSRRYLVPHSAMFGDGDGRWTDTDAALAVAYERHLAAVKADTCPSCGTRGSDWVDPDTKRLVDDEPWVAEVTSCYGCRAVAEARAQMPQGDDGLHIALVRPASDSDDEA